MDTSQKQINEIIDQFIGELEKCTTGEEWTKVHKDFCKKYHSDNGGSDDILKEINRVYDEISPTLPVRKNGGGSITYTEKQAEEMNQFQSEIASLIKKASEQLRKQYVIDRVLNPCVTHEYVEKAVNEGKGKLLKGKLQKNPDRVYANKKEGKLGGVYLDVAYTNDKGEECVLRRLNVLWSLHLAYFTSERLSYWARELIKYWWLNYYPVDEDAPIEVYIESDDNYPLKERIWIKLPLIEVDGLGFPEGWLKERRYRRKGQDFERYLCEAWLEVCYEDNPYPWFLIQPEGESKYGKRESFFKQIP